MKTIYLSILACITGIQSAHAHPPHAGFCSFRQSAVESDGAFIDVSALSKEVSPQDNFFDYVNAKWLAENPIPDSKGGWGAFHELDEKSLHTTHEIMRSYALMKNIPAMGSNQQLLADYYRSGMDSVSANRLGIQPIRPILQGVAGLKDKDAFTHLIAQFAMKGIKQPLDFYVYSDQKEVNTNVLYINAGGLGLPDRDYYFRTDDRSKQLQEAYKTYITNIFQLSGESAKSAKKKAAEVYALEEKLADATFTLVQRRDPYLTYNKVSRDELRKLAPQLNWDQYFAALGIYPEFVILESPDYVKALNEQVKSASLAQWQAYFTFHTLNSTASVLSDEFVNLHFDFHGKTVRGRLAMEERWKRITRSADAMLGELLGQEYVKTAFSPTAKKKALQLVENLRSALSDRIDALDWMGAETKAKALEKLQAINVKIGYPDKWKSYKGLEIKDQAFVLNRMAANTYEVKRNLGHLGKPVDKSEWLMNPQTVNAYYNPLYNEIVFPAAILQPPFFNEHADDACNYGGIGMVIGHELTHGFDDQGRQYDAEGNLNDWWTAEDAEKFEQKAARFIEQYNKYMPLDSVFINGELTQGENIADLGGVIIAWEGFKKANPNAPAIDGLSADERFFINFTQIWRGHTRTESLRTHLYTAPHSPEKYRVLGSLTNFQPFYDTYHVQPHHGMYTPVEERSDMW
jgi:putative endopeptidase